MTWEVEPSPDWEPLEKLLPPELCANYMHMGHTGAIQHYKHRDTRDYVHIDADTGALYTYSDGEYVQKTSEDTQYAVRKLAGR